MNENGSGHVALLIDFENLVFGLEGSCGEEYASQLDPGLLVALAEEYGQVVVANAYGDWRSKDLNQFQVDLYRLGIDLVHVLAKRQKDRMKNAVDVKMAVDAVEIIWTLPHVKTFVIVSGDRDFIHVLKVLRRHGRTVIGVSPDNAISEDFAALCDRFVRYGALSGSSNRETTNEAAGESIVPGVEAVKEALRPLMAERPGGVKGAQIKPLLKNRVSVTFDESEYGFARLSDLLLSMPDVVKLVPDSRGGDVTVVPARHGAVPGGTEPKKSVADESPQIQWIRAAKLSNYSFEPSRERRRHVLRTLFRVIREGEPCSFLQMADRVALLTDSRSLTVSLLSKYQSILWQSRAFSVEPDQQDKPMRERLLRLDLDVHTEIDLIQKYEASIVYKLVSAARTNHEKLTTDVLMAVLGIQESGAAREYCAQLMARQAHRLGSGAGATE